MENIFITNLTIEKVRHLKNIEIPLSDKTVKHLILTGKNGSGKTSVLDVLSHYLEVISAVTEEEQVKSVHDYIVHFDKKSTEKIPNNFLVPACFSAYPDSVDGISLKFNIPFDALNKRFQEGNFILAHYKADRVFQADIPRHVEKVGLKGSYSIYETPRQLFVKYLLDLKITEVLSKNSSKMEKADKIANWFQQFQELLRYIFEDKTLELKFDEDTFSFTIYEEGREPFDFNTLSSGFSAILDIVLDIIIRMENNTNKSFIFDVPGIVLIDEIETHLHLELQKNVLKLLTTVFPNIQFIVSTHSPFVLNNLENVTIYDLENHTLVENGLCNIPYDGIVEGYFKADAISDLLKEKFERYKLLVAKKELSDDDFEEIARLEMFLNEIPDYLALKITTEYQRLKAEFEGREDI